MAVTSSLMDCETEALDVMVLTASYTESEELQDLCLVLVLMGSGLGTAGIPLNLVWPLGDPAKEDTD